MWYTIGTLTIQFTPKSWCHLSWHHDSASSFWPRQSLPDQLLISLQHSLIGRLQTLTKTKTSTWGTGCRHLNPKFCHPSVTKDLLNCRLWRCRNDGVSLWLESLTFSVWLIGRHSGLHTHSDSGLRPYWNSSPRSTLQQQPLRRSLRNTNQPSATTLLTLPPSFSSCPPPLIPSLLPVIFTCWHTTSTTVKPIVLPCRFCVFPFYISLLPVVMSGARRGLGRRGGVGTEWRIKGMNLNDFLETKEVGKNPLYPPANPLYYLLSTFPPPLTSPTYRPSARKQPVFTRWLW